MVAKYDLNDDSVVVIIGTGAGGGVLANELAQKGVSVVALEAGGRYLPEDYINDEWDSFSQLAWLDARTTTATGAWPRILLDCRPGSSRQSAARQPTGLALRSASRTMNGRR